MQVGHDVRQEIISNPNCTTLTMMDALGALHRRVRPHRTGRRLLPGGVRCRPGRASTGSTTSSRTSPATACSVSGRATCAGRRGRIGEGPPFPAPLALNVVPWAGSLRRTAGREELQGPQRVAEDPRHARPQGLRHLRPGAGRHHPLGGRPRHFARRVDVGEARRGWSSAPGVVVIDDPEPGVPDPGGRGGHGPDVRRPDAAGAATSRTRLDLFVCGDNLRKGAALNTAQIAELVAAEVAEPLLSAGGLSRLLGRQVPQREVQLRSHLAERSSIDQRSVAGVVAVHLVRHCRARSSAAR